jgi:pyruvate/2-oxoglutarate dehydrogenase complex dihydrolipoamide dehydrogenase (E3) component
MHGVCCLGVGRRKDAPEEAAQNINPSIAETLNCYRRIVDSMPFGGIQTEAGCFCESARRSLVAAVPWIIMSYRSQNAIPKFESLCLTNLEDLRACKKYRSCSEGASNPRRVAETYSGYKVLAEEGTDRILGAHILGSEAGEVINLFALAIRSGMRASDLKHMIFAYPTSGSNMTRML